MALGLVGAVLLYLLASTLLAFRTPVVAMLEEAEGYAGGKVNLLFVGAQLTPKISPSAATTQTVTWTSSNKSIVKVDAKRYYHRAQKRQGHHHMHHQGRREKNGNVQSDREIKGIYPGAEPRPRALWAHIPQQSRGYLPFSASSFAMRKYVFARRSLCRPIKSLHFCRADGIIYFAVISNNQVVQPPVTQQYGEV